MISFTTAPQLPRPDSSSKDWHNTPPRSSSLTITTVNSAVPWSLQDSWRAEGFYFHHGHCEAEIPDSVQILGHHHPAATIRDGPGLRLKLPAFVQQGSCWILPAFSPWAAGAAWQPETDAQLWLCTPQRILKLPAEAPAL
ncbi:hypothetical protein BH20VER2_BH20VER2_00470 [soil metagenome]